ncbi:MAG TPA: CbtA family protein, partial [Nocardioides sp.]|nr:CbtA family protein [Nocardioides sp.]
MTKPVLTARAFLVRGLLVGLLAGIAAFLVAHQVGESHVERAIELEEAGAAEAPAEATGPGLPTFLASGSKGTLTAACNAVAMQSSVNGGPVAALTAENAALALDE